MKLTFRDRWRFWTTITTDEEDLEYRKRKQDLGGPGCQCREINYQDNFDMADCPLHKDRVKPPRPSIFKETP